MVSANLPAHRSVPVRRVPVHVHVYLPIGKTHNHRSRGDTPWRAQTVRRVPRGGSRTVLGVVDGMTALIFGQLSSGSLSFDALSQIHSHSQHTDSFTIHTNTQIHTQSPKVSPRKGTGKKTPGGSRDIQGTHPLVHWRTLDTQTHGSHG